MRSRQGDRWVFIDQVMAYVGGHHDNYDYFSRCRIVALARIPGPPEFPPNGSVGTAVPAITAPAAADDELVALRRPVLGVLEPTQYALFSITPPIQPMSSRTCACAYRLAAGCRGTVIGLQRGPPGFERPRLIRIERAGHSTSIVTVMVDRFAPP